MHNGTEIHGKYIYQQKEPFILKKNKSKRKWLKMGT